MTLLRTFSFPLLAAIALLPACNLGPGGDDDDATDDDDAADDDDDSRIPVPDPGTDPSPGSWIIDGDHTTPDRAAPMGVFPEGVREPYLQDNNIAAEDSFWVFTTSYDGAFGAGIYGAANPISAFELHEASDGFFGEVIAPSFEEMSDRGPFKEWPVTTGGIYVLHVSLEGGGFF